MQAQPMQVQPMQMDQPLAVQPIPAGQEMAWVPVVNNAGTITMCRSVASYGNGIVKVQQGHIVRLDPSIRCYRVLDVCTDEMGY